MSWEDASSLSNRGREVRGLVRDLRVPVVIRSAVVVAKESDECERECNGRETECRSLLCIQNHCGTHPEHDVQEECGNDHVVAVVELRSEWYRNGDHH